MAKVSYGKLNLNKTIETAPVQWGDVTIEVKQYLPQLEKLNLVNSILNDAADENKFYHPCRVDTFMAINIFFAYTNITITDKQREDCGKLYDLLMTSGIYQAVITAIPRSELDYLINSVNKLVEYTDHYTNSIYGILDYINSNYGDLKDDAIELINNISENKGVELLGDIVTKLN